MIATLPNAVDFVGYLGEEASIYYCVDEFTAYPHLPTAMMADMENELLQKADLIIATSRELQRRKGNRKRPTVFLPHGVDLKHFAGGVREKPCPASMQNIKRPVMGFFGVLNEWVDLELIDQMAQLRRDWSWVFIGPAQTNLDLLRRHPNVYLLGKVDYEVLPSYAAQFTVGIIPFRLNDLTINVNPLKLLEYLACGLPVVATPLPEVAIYSPLVAIADNPKDFIRSLDNAQASDNSLQRQARITVAANASWDAKAEQFSDCIQGILNGSGNA